MIGNYRSLYLAIIIGWYGEPYQVIIIDSYRGIYLAIIIGWYGQPYEGIMGIMIGNYIFGY
jgi:hypothetical protein